ncbi:MAG: methyltransferase family protein [Gemmatimonadota bacterium]
MALWRSMRDPWVLGQMALILAVGVGTVVLEDRFPQVPERGTRIAAIVLCVIAIAVGLVSAVTLGPGLTPTVVPRPDGHLVTSGPYRYVRHPLYLAVVLGLTGWSLLAGRWMAGLAVLIVASVYFSLKASAEERLLLARYPEYEHYRRRVGQLFPRLFSLSSSSS